MDHGLFPYVISVTWIGGANDTLFIDNNLDGGVSSARMSILMAKSFVEFQAVDISLHKFSIPLIAPNRSFLDRLLDPSLHEIVGSVKNASVRIYHSPTRPVASSDVLPR